MVSRSQQSLILLTVCLLTLLIIQFSSDQHSPLLFLSKALFLPLSLLQILATLLALLMVRTKLALSLFVASLILLTPSLLPMPLWHSGAPKHQPEAFSAATFSALTRTRNGADIERFATRYSPDILCLQEVLAQDIAGLAKLYPHSYRNNNNLSVISQFPLNRKNDFGGIQEFELELPNKEIIGIINVHMPRQYQQQLTTQKAWQLLPKLISNYADRQRGLILCGDLNLTPAHSTYRQLIERYDLDDAATTPSTGLVNRFAFTFPNAQRRIAFWGPWIRIDYLLSSQLQSANTQTIEASGLSDHRAVLTQYTFRQTKK